MRLGVGEHDAPVAGEVQHADGQRLGELAEQLLALAQGLAHGLDGVGIGVVGHHVDALSHGVTIGPAPVDSSRSTRQYVRPRQVRSGRSAAWVRRAATGRSASGANHHAGPRERAS